MNYLAVRQEGERQVRRNTLRNQCIQYIIN